MTSTTRKKVAFLQQYVRNNAGAWFDQFGDNIVSIQVHKKITKRNKKPYYSIVFFVEKKIKEKQIASVDLIPKSIKIKFPDEKIRNIKTDVIQSGRFKYLSNLLDEVNDPLGTGPGTAGLFLRDGVGHIFLLTNYHVAASGLINRGIFDYDIRRGDHRYDVMVDNAQCRLHLGEFNRRIDAAFIYMGNNPAVSNSLPDHTIINRNGFIDGPFEEDPWLRGMPTKVYLRSRDNCLNLPVIDNAAPLNTRDMQYLDLVTVRGCGDDGDSGGLVLGTSNQVLGIVVGRTDTQTFIIPYYKIHSIFPLQII